jgi:hypothetical protein
MYTDSADGIYFRLTANQLAARLPTEEGQTGSEHHPGSRLRHNSHASTAAGAARTTLFLVAVGYFSDAAAAIDRAFFLARPA